MLTKRFPLSDGSHVLLEAEEDEYLIYSVERGGLISQVDSGYALDYEGDEALTLIVGEPFAKYWRDVFEGLDVEPPSRYATRTNKEKSRMSSMKKSRMRSMKKRFSREASFIETDWQPGEPMPSIPIWELRSAFDVDDLDRFDATTELYLAGKTFSYTNDSDSYSCSYGYLDGYDYVHEGGGIAKTPEELFAAIDNWINQTKILRRSNKVRRARTKRALSIDTGEGFEEYFNMILEEAKNQVGHVSLVYIGRGDQLTDPQAFALVSGDTIGLYLTESLDTWVGERQADGAHETANEALQAAINALDLPETDDLGYLIDWQDEVEAREELFEDLLDYIYGQDTSNPLADLIWNSPSATVSAPVMMESGYVYNDVTFKVDLMEVLEKDAASPSGKGFSHFVIEDAEFEYPLEEGEEHPGTITIPRDEISSVEVGGYATNDEDHVRLAGRKSRKALNRPRNAANRRTQASIRRRPKNPSGLNLARNRGIAASTSLRSRRANQPVVTVPGQETPPEGYEYDENGNLVPVLARRRPQSRKSRLNRQARAYRTTRN